MAEETVRFKNVGLRGFTVADTKVSFIDGQKGVLIYRGFRIEDLAKNSTFEETAYLLVRGTLPTKKELAQFKEDLVAARELPGYVYDALRALPREAVPMDVLQGIIPFLATADPDLYDDSREANERMATRLIARMPVVIAAWHNIRQGKDPMESRNDLDHAANFLWLFHGKGPDEEVAKAMDVCLILHADHTFNASTFACREVVSTRAHMYAGVSGGIGALSGSLHGGANARVMRMLKSIENEPDLPAWVEKQVSSGERIMGMGHAIYKTMDPRAVFLREMSERLGKKVGEEQWFRMSTEIEETAMKYFDSKGKTDIRPNVDFYSASVYHVMGIPGDIMTPIFAISRVSGWCAHIIEEKFGDAQGKPALYRPKAEYVGEYCGLMGCEYKPKD